MRLGRDVRRHNELDNWRNTHRYESVMADYMALVDDIRKPTLAYGTGSNTKTKAKVKCTYL